MEKINSIKEFDWDEGNLNKNWLRHKVLNLECEEVFFNQPLILKEDPSHSLNEDRFYVLGRTNQERLLYVVFTVQNRKIRIISARDMNEKERKIFNNAT